jgi:hypothetical protein
MAEETVKIIGLKVETGDAEQSLNNFGKKLGEIGNQPNLSKPISTLKQDLKEAQNDAQRLFKEFGSGSQEFLKAAQKVTQLKNDIDEVAITIKNVNVDNILRPIQSFASASIGLFQGVQGSLALIGVESEDLQATMVKLQALMNISAAIDSFGDLKDTLVNIKSLVTSSTAAQKAYNLATVAAAAIQKAFTGAVVSTSVGFKALRAAIISTGIGALIVGVTALVSKIQDWVSGSKAAERANEDLGKSFDRLKEATEATSTSIELSKNLLIAYAREAGKSANEIANISRVALQEQFKNLQKQYVNARMQFDAVQSQLNKEDREKRLAELEQLNKGVAKAYSDITLFEANERADAAEERRKRDKEASDKARSEAEKAAAERKSEREKELSEIEGFNKEVENLNNEALKAIAERGLSERQLEQRNNKLAYDEGLSAITKATIAERARLDKDLKERIINKEQYEKKKLELQNKYSQESINFLTKYLNTEQDIEEKYRKLISDFIEERNQTDFQNKRKDLISQFDELIKLADEKQKALLEASKTDALAQVDREETLRKNTVTTETSLIITKTENIADEKDPAKLARTKIENIRVAELDAEAAAFELKKEQARGHAEELAKIEAEHAAAVVQINKDAAEDTKAIDDKAKEAKKANLEAVSNLLGNAANLFSKHTVAYKALAVAQATIDTYKGAVSAYNSMSAIPVVGPALGVVAAGVAVASGIANVKKILSTKVKGDTSSGAGSLSGASMQAAPVISAANTASNNYQPQDVRITNQQNLGDVRAYITEKDLEKHQQQKDFRNTLQNF